MDNDIKKRIEAMDDKIASLESCLEDLRFSLEEIREDAEAEDEDWDKPRTIIKTYVSRGWDDIAKSLRNGSFETIDYPIGCTVETSFVGEGTIGMQLVSIKNGVAVFLADTPLRFKHPLSPDSSTWCDHSFVDTDLGEYLNSVLFEVAEPGFKETVKYAVKKTGSNCGTAGLIRIPSSDEIFGDGYERLMLFEKGAPTFWRDEDESSLRWWLMDDVHSGKGKFVNESGVLDETTADACMSIRICIDVPL